MKERKKPSLILFCGLPGAGKTRVAKQVEQQLHAVRLCADDWLADLEIDVYDEKKRDAIGAKLYDFAKELLDKGVSVILEDGLWSKKEREEKLEAAQVREVPVTLHVFDLQPEELWKRLDHRNNNLQNNAVPVSRDLLEMCISMFELPGVDELEKYATVKTYTDDTSLDLSLS